ncbi:MAG: hypothetical protein GF313_05145 [Caldithrix sp.]|nr:hypothetical protein [Caldithrix sp.]
MIKKRLTTQLPCYLGSLEYFWKIAQCDVLVLTDQLQYTKRSVASISAPLKENDDRLRIPVKHDEQPTPIFKKRIDTSLNWTRKHYKTLYHTYHHLPFAYYYLPQLNEVFDRLPSKLTDVLYNIIMLISGWLHFDVQIITGSSITNFEEANAFIRQAMHQYQASIYLNDETVFRRNWVSKKILNEFGVETKTFYPLPDSHLFRSYAHQSILLFILQFGPESGYLIKQYLPESLSSNRFK